MRKSGKYPMYPERVRARLLERDARRSLVERPAPQIMSEPDVWPEFEDGNAFKGLMVGLGMSIPLWVLLVVLIRWIS